MEEENLSKIEDTLKMIGLLEEKNEIYKDNIMKNIDFLESQIDKL